LLSGCGAAAWSEGGGRAVVAARTVAVVESREARMELVALLGALVDQKVYELEAEHVKSLGLNR